MRASTDFLLREIAGEFMLVPVGPGASGINGLVTLNEIGAIVGTNYGTISGCSFSGTISGQNNVGGIAGTNEGSGMIYNCKTEGSVEGDHYVGGIVGQNVGTISYCSNTTGVNVSASEAVDNVEDLDSLTLPTASDDDDDDIPKKANLHGRGRYLRLLVRRHHRLHELGRRRL